METVILVCGGRDYANRTHVYEYLDRCLDEYGEVYIVTGGATGADSLAMEWAQDNEQPYMTHPAKWGKYGKKAGPIRNSYMLMTDRPDIVVAFPGGSGTEDMVRKAEAAKIRVFRA